MGWGFTVVPRTYLAVTVSLVGGIETANSGLLGQRFGSYGWVTPQSFEKIKPNLTYVRGTSGHIMNPLAFIHGVFTLKPKG